MSYMYNGYVTICYKRTYIFMLYVYVLYMYICICIVYVLYMYICMLIIESSITLKIKVHIRLHSYLLQSLGAPY